MARTSDFAATPILLPREIPGALWSLRRADRSSLRAAWWALGAARTARGQLTRGGVNELALPRPPALPDSAARGVRAVLRRRAERCLVSAAVWQEWHAARGAYCDLIIGVTAPNEDFGAHAWLEGDPMALDGFVEISRHPARR